MPLFLILPMGFITLLLMARAWQEQKQVNAARRWAQTAGRILSSSVEEIAVPVRVNTSIRRYRMAVRYAPSVVYEYFVNDARYQSERLRLGSRLLSSEACDLEREIRRYPTSGAVTVWYDPANPAEAVLDRHTGVGTRVQWLASVVMLVCTLAIIMVFCR